jgi:hypothetical protein
MDGGRLATWRSLAEVTMRLHNRRVGLGALGQHWLQMWAAAMTRATGVRAGAGRPFIDVSLTRWRRCRTIRPAGPQAGWSRCTF